jgi:hypothetical protein
MATAPGPAASTRRQATADASWGEFQLRMLAYALPFAMPAAGEAAARRQAQVLEEEADHSAFQLRMMANALEGAPPPQPQAPAVRFVMPAAGAAPASSRSLAQHRLPRRALCAHGCGALVWEEEKDRCCKKGDMRLSEEHNPPISPQYLQLLQQPGVSHNSRQLNRQLAAPLSHICAGPAPNLCHPNKAFHGYRSPFTPPGLPFQAQRKILGRCSSNSITPPEGRVPTSSYT